MEMPEILKLSEADISKKIEELRSELRLYHFKRKGEEQKDTSVVKKTRKNIARLKTALNAKGDQS